MKQRLGLAAALLGSPKLVLLDEPTNGLDPAGIHEMRELIKSLPSKYGMTVMISSHLLAEMEQTADYIGIISQGQLIFQDTLARLQEQNTRYLRLRTSDDALAASLLRERPIPGGTPVCLDGDGLRIPLPPDRTAAAVMRRLFEAGIDLYRAQESAQSLEDIYLDMVKEAGL